MEGDIKCHTTQCRKSPNAGQSSGAEHGHMRVVRPVVDRGEWWSHPTPSPGILQKQEIQDSRKDPFFYQIPGCNLAPSGQGIGRERRKAAAKWGQYWVERQKQNADTDTCFGIWKVFGEPVENSLAWNHHCSTEPHTSFCVENVHLSLLVDQPLGYFIFLMASSFSSDTVQYCVYGSCFCCCPTYQCILYLVGKHSYGTRLMLVHARNLKVL